jgi:predicted CopG family antitoxin
MATKTITIKEGVYNLLRSIKEKDESFSNLFERLVRSKRNIDVLKELRADVKFEDKDALLNEIYEKRKEIRY